MRFIVPFDPHEPSTRLAPVLSDQQRREFADAMLTDVLGAVREAGYEPELLSTAELDRECQVTVDDRSLTAAVNAVLEASTPVAVVMADLPLATARSIERLLDAPGDVVIAPGLGGGTNALCTRHPAFRVDYHGGSYRKHCRQARDCGATFHTLDSFRLAVDADEPADLAEVLLHGDGSAAEWLRTNGFEVDTEDGRCTVRQRTE